MQRFGKYEVVRKIGEGGFGQVFEGYDPAIRRRVAIKTCLADYPEVRARFLREASIAGNLQHRNITVVFDLGEQDGTPYLVQEYLEGRDLDEVIGDGEELPLEDQLGYLTQLARGLGYAHSQGVIHRDIKPSNLRVLDEGLLKIMDFGIARSNRSDTSLTATGETVGTSTYLSPEQIRGDQTLDARCDIYAFGAVAFELLTGRPLYAPTSPQRLIYQIVREPPPDVDELAPDSPERLRAVVRRCLQKDRDLRYANCSELLMELNQTAASRPRASASLSGPTWEFRTVPRAGDTDPVAAPRALAGRAEALPAAAAGQAGLGGGDRETAEVGDAMPLGKVQRPVSSRPRTPRRDDDEFDTNPDFDTAEVEPIRRAPRSGSGLRTLAGGSDPSERSPATWLRPAAAAGLVVVALIAAALLWSAGGQESEGQGVVARPETGDQRRAETTSAPATGTAGADPRRSAATLRLLPGWDPSIRVSIDGDNALILDGEVIEEIEAGGHLLEYSILLDDYQAFETVAVELEPGQRLAIEPPLAEPGRLTVRAPSTSRDLFVRLGDAPLGWTPLESRRVAPGLHQLQLSDSPAAIARALEIDVASGEETLVVSGLDAAVEPMVQRRPLD